MQVKKFAYLANSLTSFAKAASRTFEVSVGLRSRRILSRLTIRPGFDRVSRRPVRVIKMSRFYT